MSVVCPMSNSLPILTMLAEAISRDSTMKRVRNEEFLMNDLMDSGNSRSAATGSAYVRRHEEKTCLTEFWP